MAKGWSFGSLVSSLKSAAFLDVGTSSGTVAAGDDSRIVNALQKSDNLYSIQDAAQARANLHSAYEKGDSNLVFYCAQTGDPTAAVNNDRLDYKLTSKANYSGSEWQTFDVNPATKDTHAVRLDQFKSGASNGSAYSIFPNGPKWCRANLNIPAKSSVQWDFPIKFTSQPTVFVSAIGGTPNVWCSSLGPEAASFYNDNSSGLNVNVLAIW